MYHYYITTHFKRQLKPYLKKFPNIFFDMADLLAVFVPAHHIHLGANVFKIRLKSTDLPRGKNKSFRLIIILVRERNIISPLYIYLKSTRQSIPKSEISYHMRAVKQEINKIP